MRAARMVERQPRDDENRQRDDERRDGRIQHVTDVRENRHPDGRRGKHRGIGQERELVAEISAGDDRARDPPFGETHGLPGAHQRHADRGDRRPRTAGHQRNARADDARGNQEERGVQDLQPVIDHRRHHAAHHPRPGYGADQQQDDDCRSRSPDVVDDRLFQDRPLAAVNADGQHDADRRGRQQCELAAAGDRVPAETADDHVKQQRQHRQRQHRHPRRRLFGRIFFHFRIPINHTDGKNTKNLPHIRTPGTGDNHFRPEDMRVQLFRAHCFLFPKFYLFLVKDSDGYGGTNNQKDLPVLPRRVPEHDSRQNPVGHHPGQAVHPVRNPQGILFSRFPGRAEPRRAQPFGHERTNPRQITIAYVI